MLGALLVLGAACGDDDPLAGDTGARDQGGSDSADLEIGLDTSTDMDEDTPSGDQGLDMGTDPDESPDLETPDADADVSDAEGDADAEVGSDMDLGGDADDAGADADVDADVFGGDAGEILEDVVDPDAGFDLGDADLASFDAETGFDFGPDGLPDGLLPDLGYDAEVSELDPCEEIDTMGGTLAPIDVALTVLNNYAPGGTVQNTGDLYIRIATSQFPTSDVIYVQEEPGLRARDWQNRGQEFPTRLCFAAAPGTDLYINVVLDRDPRNGLESLGLEDLEGGLLEPITTVSPGGETLPTVRVEIVERGT